MARLEFRSRFHIGVVDVKVLPLTSKISRRQQNVDININISHDAKLVGMKNSPDPCLMSSRKVADDIRKADVIINVRTP